MTQHPFRNRHRAPLEALHQWVVWQYEERDGKPTKVPYAPELFGPRRASATDPETWDSHTMAKAVHSRRSYDGIGFVFTEADPYCGIDLDDCIKESGEIEEWARPIVDALDSYTEYSPSGRGLHIIVEADLSGLMGNRRGSIEMYDRNRYFTMPGGAPYRDRPVAERQEAVEAIHAEHVAAQGSVPVEPTRKAPPLDISDEDLLRKARAAKNGDAFSALYDHGDLSANNGNSSDADMALVNHLAYWTRKDPQRMDALFRSSALMRKKWDEVHYSGGVTYGQHAIDKAIRDVTRVYDPEGMTPNDAVTPKTNDAKVGVTRGEARIPDKTAPLRLVGGPSDANDANDAKSEGGAETRIAPVSLRHTPAHPFPVHVLTKTVRDLVVGVARSMDCHPDLVAMPALFAISTAIGKSRRGFVKSDWFQYPSLFLGVVASPGSMKTPAATPALKPLRKIQKEYNELYAQKREAYEAELREYEVTKKACKQADEPAPPPPERPLPRQVLVSDTTWEAMVDVLTINGSIGVHSDELSGWIRAMDQYKSGGKGSERQNWLSTWSSDDISQNRRGSDGPIYIEEPFVSVYGGIQPAVLHELGGANTDGLLDRFLLSYVPNKVVKATEFVVEKDVTNRYEWLVDSLHNLKSSEVEDLPFTVDARDLFFKLTDSLSIESHQRTFPVELEALWAKLRGYTARLALLLYVTRKTDERGQETAIEKEDVFAAWQLVEYFKSHAKRVHGILGPTDPVDGFVASLKDLLEDLEEAEYVGTSQGLMEALSERGAENLPKKPEHLTRRVKAACQRSPDLVFTNMRTGKARKFKVELVTKTEHSPVQYVDMDELLSEYEDPVDLASLASLASPAPEPETESPIDKPNSPPEDAPGEVTPTPDVGVTEDLSVTPPKADEPCMHSIPGNPPLLARDCYLCKRKLVE